MSKRLRVAVVGLLVCLVLPISTYADEITHSGTWQVVEARTWFSDGSTPDGFSLALVLQFSGSDFVYQSVNATDKSKPPQEFEFAATLDGAV